MIIHIYKVLSICKLYSHQKSESSKTPQEVGIALTTIWLMSSVQCRQLKESAQDFRIQKHRLGTRPARAQVLALPFSFLQQIFIERLIMGVPASDFTSQNLNFLFVKES